MGEVSYSLRPTRNGGRPIQCAIVTTTLKLPDDIVSGVYYIRTTYVYKVLPWMKRKTVQKTNTFRVIE